MEFFLRKGTLGFFSDAFRLLESYMVCKQQGVKLYLNSAEWTFAHTLGWSDYFTTMAEKHEGGILTEIAIDGEEIRQFTVAQYKQSIKELFVFQPHLLEKARALQRKLGVDKYVAVFIRRGDKLLGESLFIPSYQHNNTTYVYSQNLQYLSTNVPQKALMDYTNAEMREHVEEMLVGIIICQSADFIVLDHMSNVSRFIHFSHPRGKEAILAIEDMDIQIAEGVRLIKRYEYSEDKLIRNPRHHSIYNDYI